MCAVQVLSYESDRKLTIIVEKSLFEKSTFNHERVLVFRDTLTYLTYLLYPQTEYFPSKIIKRNMFSLHQSSKKNNFFLIFFIWDYNPELARVIPTSFFKQNVSCVWHFQLVIFRVFKTFSKSSNHLSGSLPNFFHKGL